MFLMDRFFDGTFLTFGIEVISFAERDQEDRIDPMVRRVEEGEEENGRWGRGDIMVEEESVSQLAVHRSMVMIAHSVLCDANAGLFHRSYHTVTLHNGIKLCQPYGAFFASS